jgi:hypothetical protein
MMPRFSGRILSRARLRASPDVRPRGGDGSGRSVRYGHGAGNGTPLLLSFAAAEFIESLRRPNTVGSYRAPARAVARLVLDGLLQIEWRGRFRCGPAAHASFFAPTPVRRPRHPLARLSFDALSLTATHGAASAAHLATRLYRYNSRPISPAWRTRYDSVDAVSRLLRTSPIGSHRVDRLRSRVRGVWLVTAAPRARRPPTGIAPFKLYVSPTPALTGEAYRAVRDSLLGRHAPFTVKVGRDLSALLRPDRLVAYFAERDDLLETAQLLRKRLDGMSAQGVPFTAPTGRGALLSWGVDLAPDDTFHDRGRDRSWRSWLVMRLGVALAAAQRQRGVDPVRFAIDRVWLDGVRTGNWEPSAALLRKLRAAGRPRHVDS